MDTYVSAIAAVLAITRPVTKIGNFLEITGRRTPMEYVRPAGMVAVWVFLILAVSAVGGTAFLEWIGVTLPAFRVAGGVIIVLMGFQMLWGGKSSTQDEGEVRGKDDNTEDQLVVPLAMPLIAGPGAIATVITVASTYDDAGGIPRHALAAALATAIMVFVAFSIAGLIGKGTSPRTDRIVTKLMGMMLAAIGFQMLLAGTKQYFSL